MSEQNIIMAILNPRVISQSVSDPAFLSRALNTILGRGIMGLGHGVLLDDHLMHNFKAIKNGDFVPKNMANGVFNPLELMVVMNEYHTDDPSPLDSLKQMLQGGAGRNNTHEKYVNGQYILGEYDIELVLAYNPSAPSLYIFTFDGNDNWDSLKNYNTPSGDIVKEIETKLDDLKPINKEQRLDDSLSGFVDTSIRLIYLMKRISSYAAINYQEV